MCVFDISTGSGISFNLNLGLTSVFGGWTDGCVLEKFGFMTVLVGFSV